MHNQEGIDAPDAERLGKLNSRSCGVAFVADDSNERMECRASGKTSCQHSTGKLRDATEGRGYGSPDDSVITLHLAVSTGVITSSPSACDALRYQKFT